MLPEKYGKWPTRPSVLLDLNEMMSCERRCKIYDVEKKCKSMEIFRYAQWHNERQQYFMGVIIGAFKSEDIMSKKLYHKFTLVNWGYEPTITAEFT